MTAECRKEREALFAILKLAALYKTSFAQRVQRLAREGLEPIVESEGKGTP